MADDELALLSITIHPQPDLARVHKALSYYRHLVDVNTYVIGRWQEPFTLKEIAQAIGISPSRLSHLFLEKTGITFRDWVRYERVKRAAILLNGNEMSNCEVAQSSGFSSRQALERNFRKATGLSPAKYRKQCETHFLTQP